MSYSPLYFSAFQRLTRPRRDVIGFCTLLALFLGDTVDLSHSALAGSLRELAFSMDQCRNATEPALKVEHCSIVISRSADRKIRERAFNSRGHAYMALNRFAEAANDFTAVIRLNPRIAGYYDNRQNAFKALGRLDDALADANKAVRLAPTYAFVYAARGNVLAELGQYDPALQDFTTAISLDPKNAGNFVGRGTIFVKARQLREAFADFTHALGMDMTAAFRERVLALRDQTSEDMASLSEQRSTVSPKAPAPCNPDAPYGGRAPQWAVDEEKSHGNDAVPAATDPVWQHATCDEYHHRVTWYFPGEDQPNHPPVAASAAKQPREVERPSTPKVETASEPNTQSSLAVQTPNEPSTLSQSPRVISIEPLQSAKGNADLGSADIQRIHATYENNQARFFRDFAGKRFSSKMPIARVSENVIFRGSFNVFLGPGGLLGDVQCEVSNKNDVARITEMNMGDIVTVSGVIKDHTLGVIELKDCSISASQ